MDERHAGVATDRRTFLRLAALGAAAAGGGSLIAGCGEVSSSSGVATAVDEVSGLVPTYRALPLQLPQPDLKGVAPGPDGFSRYPGSLVDAITGPKPGTSGRPITAMMPLWGSAPSPLGQNSYLDTINTELGTPVDFSLQDGNSYSDKLNAMFGARDVPELLCVPAWELLDIPRATAAIETLFEDLTPYLAGDAAAAYPMLANLPTESWRQSVWAGRLFAIPNPSAGSTPTVMHYRKDLLDAYGLTYPKTLEELRAIAAEVTDPARGVWAFNNIYQIVEMAYKVPFARDFWGLDDAGRPVGGIETPQYREALAFNVGLFADGFVHPDVLANDATDSKTLLESGKILFMRDGIGSWQPMQAEQQKITPGFDMQPVPPMSAVGGDPLAWYRQQPTSYTFIRKGLPRERVEELLRVVDWCSAPFGTQEYELRELGVAGRHFEPTPAGPVRTELSFQEVANQYRWISGRPPVEQPTPDTPDYPRQYVEFNNNSIVPFREEDPWQGLQLEWPARYGAINAATEGKINDVLRGRRPLSDLDTIVAEWRAGGGDEARAFLATALEDAGR